MKKSIWSVLMVSTLVLGACKESPLLSDSAIIPLPQEINDGSGSFNLTPETGIRLVGSGEHLTAIGEHLAEKLRPASGFDVPVSADAGQIVLELTGSEASESYEIQISEKEVKITSSGEAGLFYGVQTLLQLFPKEIANSTVQ